MHIKISFIKHKSKPYLLGKTQFVFLYFISVTVMCLVLLSFGGSASAASKEAIAACKKERAQYKPLCEGGYEAAKAGKSKTEACRANKGKETKAACERGHKSGAASKSGGLNIIGLNGKSIGDPQCGKGDTEVKTKFDLGCLGLNYKGNNLNPITDMFFAFIRFLSVGVGLVIAGSIIVAGIRYATSEGNAEVTKAAQDRIQTTLIALITYMFIFALLQYLVPGGILAPK